MWERGTVTAHQNGERSLRRWGAPSARSILCVVAALALALWSLGDTPAEARLLQPKGVDLGLDLPAAEDDGYGSYILDPSFAPPGYVQKDGWKGEVFDSDYAQQFDRPIQRFSVHLRAHRVRTLDELAGQLLSYSNPGLPAAGANGRSLCPDKVDAIRPSLAGQQTLIEIPCNYSEPSYSDSPDGVLALYVHGLTAIKVEVEGGALIRPVTNGPNEVVEPTPLYDELMAQARLFAQAFLANAKAEGFDTVAGYDDQQHPPTSETATNGSPGGGEVRSGGATTDRNPGAETTAAILTAAGAAAAGGLAGFGAWLMLGQMGVGRREALEGLGDLLRGRLPDDGFDAWKAKYQALGWTYREENGIAVFDPPPGYAEPPPMAVPGHHDGDVSPQTGEVWSDEDGGWIGRNLYDQERGRRAFIDEVNNRAATQDEDVRRLQQNWLDAKKKLADLPAVFANVEARKEMMERRIQEMIDNSDDPNRRQFLGALRGKVGEVDVTDSKNQLATLRRTLNRDLEPGFKQTAFVSTSVIHGGAFLADVFLTRGAATAAVHALESADASVAEGRSLLYSALDGANTGAKTMLSFWATGEVFTAAGSALAEAAPGAADAIESLANTKVSLRPANAEGAASNTRIWGSNMSAVREEVDARAAASLSERGVGSRIANANRGGEINRALREIGGDAYDPRLVTVTRRLTPDHTTYEAGKDALALDEMARRALTPEARQMADAVRQDLYFKSIEGGAKRLYAERPDLAGKLLRVDNTGSHAVKGANYGGLRSDFDGTIIGDGTPAGDEAARLFGRYQAEEVSSLTNGRLTNENLKIHIYTGEGVGTGAYRSEAGLAMKDMMNATSGRIDVLNAEGNLTHSLRGGDVVETGVGPARFTSVEGISESEAATYLKGFRQDSLNKFHEELPEMKTAQEQAIQAGKAYKLTRIAEGKLPGGRTLEVDRELYDLAKTIKTESQNMSSEALDALRDRFLSTLQMN